VAIEGLCSFGVDCERVVGGWWCGVLLFVAGCESVKSERGDERKKEMRREKRVGIKEKEWAKRNNRPSKSESGNGEGRRKKGRREGRKGWWRTVWVMRNGEWGCGVVKSKGNNGERGWVGLGGRDI